MSALFSIGQKLWKDYQEQTSQKLKLIDSYLVFVLLTGTIQFVYCCLVGTFPFNSFLSGFISCVGTFVFTVSLRIQVNPDNSFPGISHERAFADFLFCNILLHLFVINFLG